MNSSSHLLRLIISDPLSGPTNMAIDQAILESTVETGEITLRFYRWKTPTLSLGYFQKLADRELHQASLECPVVRRSSGGGAIVHDDELTYSLCVPTSGAIAKANADLYDTVHHAIRKSLSEQNVAVSLYESTAGTDAKASQSDPFLCFQRRAVGDLVCQNEKVGGSAQRRLKNVLIQHGSLLLSQSKNSPELPGLRELTGIVIDTSALIQQITSELSGFFKAKFEPRSLSRPEIKLASEIDSKTFSAEAWLQKR